MALTVEDGAGNAAADAFVSLEACDAYCIAHGLADWTGATRSPPEDDEAAIRRATAWLSGAFTWKGSKLNGRSQALAWPRVNVTDEEWNEVASDTVPVEIVQACCIAAAYERANPGGLSPAVTIGNRVKSKGVGPLRKEYFAAPMTPEAMRPVLTRVRDVIGGLLSDSSNSLVGRVVRG